MDSVGTWIRRWHERRHKCRAFPSADSFLEHKWAEQEYLGLYKRIVYADVNGESGMHWLVLDHRNNVGEKLETWLKA